MLRTFQMTLVIFGIFWFEEKSTTAQYVVSASSLGGIGFDPRSVHE